MRTFTFISSTVLLISLVTTAKVFIAGSIPSGCLVITESQSPIILNDGTDSCDKLNGTYKHLQLDKGGNRYTINRFI
jgi:hypothetical protein